MSRLIVLFIFIAFLVGCGPIKYIKGDTFRTKIWMDGKDNYYKKGVELKGGGVLFEVLPEKQHVFAHGGLSVKKNNKGRFKVTEVHSKEDLSQWRQQIKINNEKKKLEQVEEKERVKVKKERTRVKKEKERVLRLKKLQNARGKWGLKFGMTKDDVINFSNKEITSCFDYAFIFGVACTKSNGDSFSVSFIKNKGLSEIVLLRGSHNYQDFNNLISKLKKKYTLLPGPYKYLENKYNYGLGDGDLHYLFENKKDNRKPKYIKLFTTQEFNKYQMRTGRNTHIGYLSDEGGKSVIEEFNSLMGKNDDL
jgi:hypothetical protein